MRSVACRLRKVSCVIKKNLSQLMGLKIPGAKRALLVEDTSAVEIKCAMFFMKGN